MPGPRASHRTRTHPQGRPRSPAQLVQPFPQIHGAGRKLHKFGAFNIKAIPDKEDEALLNQLMGAKGVSVSDAGEKTEQPAADNSDNPGKVDSDDLHTPLEGWVLREPEKSAKGKEWERAWLSLCGAKRPR